MIRVKKGNCQIIGNKMQSLSECTVAIIACAEIIAKDLNKSVEEATDILCQTAKESYRRANNEKL